MLSVEGFKTQLDNIDHQTNLYNTFGGKSHLESRKNSKEVLVNSFIEQKREIERLRKILSHK